MDPAPGFQLHLRSRHPVHPGGSRGHQQLGMAGSSTQGSSWVPPASASSCPMAKNDDDSGVQAWYVSSIAYESLSVHFISCDPYV
jgi:hypothetical protein